MRPLLWFVVAFCAWMTGCVAPQQVMVHPDSKQTVDCSTAGWGWLGAPMALIMHEQCIERYQKMGFITVEDYQASSTSPRDYSTPTQAGKIIVTSEPTGASILAGPSPGNVGIFLGYAPLELRHTKGGRLWGAECYQAKFNHDEPSHVVCRPQEYGDRVIHFVYQKTGVKASDEE